MNHPHARAIQRYFEDVWNQGRLEVLDELLTPDYRNHSPGTPNPLPGPAGLKPIVAAMRAAFPDLHYIIEDLILGESAAAVRVTLTGTHEGDFFGIPPTSKKVRVSQMNIEQFRDGRIAQHWRVTDEIGLMRQLGVLR